MRLSEILQTFALFFPYFFGSEVIRNTSIFFSFFPPLIFLQVRLSEVLKRFVAFLSFFFSPNFLEVRLSEALLYFWEVKFPSKHDGIDGRAPPPLQFGSEVIACIGT